MIAVKKKERSETYYEITVPDTPGSSLRYVALLSKEGAIELYDKLRDELKGPKPPCGKDECNKCPYYTFGCCLAVPWGCLWEEPK
jgi:hypothetical protein